MVRTKAMALAALALGLVTLVCGLVLAITAFADGLLGLAVIALALVAAWHGLLNRGTERLVAFGAATALLVTGATLVLRGEPLLSTVALLALPGTIVTARTAFRIHVPLPPAQRPRQPVLIYNPRSGRGTAHQLDLAGAARARGIQAVALHDGACLEQLVRAAVDAGCDAVGMAGGDGSQAIVARTAAELGVPYACIPTGTRNHFALDLGVDRNDVFGALDAMVDGGERIVDLGEVNGHVFVNNVSLGPYATALHRPGYRSAKLRTLLGAAPGALGGVDRGRHVHWFDPEGREHRTPAPIVISNNRYRLGRVLVSGTRPRLDQGLLGVAVLMPGSSVATRMTLCRPWLEWTTRSFSVDARGPVLAGVDGEPLILDPPLRFRIRPTTLRCRIARAHPGASPSAFTPEQPWQALRALIGIAVGRDPRPVPRSKRDPTGQLRRGAAAGGPGQLDPLPSREAHLRCEAHARDGKPSTVMGSA